MPSASWDELHTLQCHPLLRTLETLDLSANHLEDRGLHALKEALIGNRSIWRLGLASVQITCEGAVVLAEFLAESRFLQTLDVRQNLILTGGLMAFALALKLNRTLVLLDLDRNPKEEKRTVLTRRGNRVRQDRPRARGCVLEKCVTACVFVCDNGMFV
ncbi:Protein phosphatase 1 regulatory subunit 37 [Bagarius yarrelli]|uniref:Protein phosphatase 1 regulatory subunit 37 n=1 Tax=Bagarius yarrelli TaxID=175774 RepID=A0A556V5I7_BAGYA|nr:Protein phosphatase 1 regulatory subunit 37 [Bagarius yarrelli]